MREQFGIAARPRRTASAYEPSRRLLDAQLCAEARDLRVLAREVRVRSATASSSTNEPSPVTSSRWIRTVSHSSRCRRFSTTTSTPSVSVSAASISVRRRHHAVRGHAHLGVVGPHVGDQVRLPRLLLAQLQPPGGDAEVRVALHDHALVRGPERQRALERARRVRVDGLELDVAARPAHRSEAIACARVDGVTVVDHPLVPAI